MGSHGPPCMAMTLALNTPAAACTENGKPSRLKGRIHGHIMTYPSLVVANHTPKCLVLVGNPVNLWYGKSFVICLIQNVAVVAL